MTSKESARTILIDTDTASDDAVALIMALRASHVRVAAITVVAGNVGVEQATQNALYTVELCGAQVPVYQGAARPLTRTLETADWFHGKDGLGDHGYTPARLEAAPEHAVDAIVRIVGENPGIELITLGPLTNLALALAREPRLIEKIGRCVVMGGAPCCEGNVTPAAEFNIWADPETARMVFVSGLKIEMVGWQLCGGEAVVGPAEIEKILALGTPTAEFAVRCNRTAIWTALAFTRGGVECHAQRGSRSNDLSTCDQPEAAKGIHAGSRNRPHGWPHRAAHRRRKARPRLRRL